MRIAQVAPLYESVPPRYYGGTERVVSYLTEELVRQGHDVTLYASGDSVTRAHLVSPCKTALWRDPDCIDYMAPHILMLEWVAAEASGYDLIHFHIDYLHFPLSRRSAVPTLTTLHGRLDIPELVPLYQEFPEMPVVSISDAQRKPLPRANWRGTVYHGLPEDLYTLHTRPGDYLAFLGRLSPEKQVEGAVEIARRVGMPLKIGGKIDKTNLEYFEQVVRPLLSDPLVEFVGEVGEHEKNAFLGNAYALVFPINWPEPFGLVVTEAMACGTPVVAFRRGAMPEILDDGLTGFVVDNVDQAVEAVGRVDTIDRRRCRAVFEERFSATRMALDYTAIYQQFVKGRTEMVPA